MQIYLGRLTFVLSDSLFGTAEYIFITAVHIFGTVVHIFDTAEQRIETEVITFTNVIWKIY